MKRIVAGVLIVVASLFLLPAPYCLAQDVCEGNFDCDQDVDGSDLTTFIIDFNRSSMNNPCDSSNPCKGNFDCDSDVDGTDTHKFKIHFGRNALVNACNACLEEDVCVYP